MAGVQFQDVSPIIATVVVELSQISSYNHQSSSCFQLNTPFEPASCETTNWIVIARTDVSEDPAASIIMVEDHKGKRIV